MTGLDPVKAVRAIRAEEDADHHVDPAGRDQMEQAKGRGVDHYLVKPFQTVQLRDSLHDIFDGAVAPSPSSRDRLAARPSERRAGTAPAAFGNLGLPPSSLRDRLAGAVMRITALADV